MALLFGGVDKVGGEAKPSLYHADPSGTFIRYHAKAIGERAAPRPEHGSPLLAPLTTTTPVPPHLLTPSLLCTQPHQQGSGSEGAQTALQEGYNKDMTFEEAETLALQTLKQVMEEQISPGNVEVAAVKVDKPFHLYTKEEIDAILGRLSA